MGLTKRQTEPENAMKNGTENGMENGKRNIDSFLRGTLTACITKWQTEPENGTENGMETLTAFLEAQTVRLLVIIVPDHGMKGEE